MSHYTLLRHSAYAVEANPDFEDAVEVRELNAQQVYYVRAAGGLLFPTLAEAEAAARAANFPSGDPNARAHASGYFSSVRIGAAEVYVPRAAAADGSDPR
jgi:hypothetical protein